jgi:hypothetical protein
MTTGDPDCAALFLKSDFHGASGRVTAGGAERTTLTATARYVMEVRSTPLIQE